MQQWSCPSVKKIYPCQNIKTHALYCRDESVAASVVKLEALTCGWISVVFSEGAYAYNYTDTYFLHDSLPSIMASLFRGGKKKNEYQVNWNSLMFFY